MKTKTFLIISSTLAASLALPFNGDARSSAFLEAQSSGGQIHSDLTVEVIGLSSTEGQVLVGLYNSQDGFKNEREMQGKTVSVNSEKVLIEFNNLPVGEYALKVFHDEDADGKLDTNGLGIPSEAYGFSNNASDPFSAPEWDEANFALPRGKMTQTIDLG